MYFWKPELAVFAFWRRALSSKGESSALTRALFLMLFARMPKRSVESVSASLYDDGEQLMTSVVRELPPSDSCRMRVSFESRYGMCFACARRQRCARARACAPRLAFESVSALMTMPSAESDLLIFLASSSVWPDAPVLPTFSEPARSTRYRFPVFCAPVSVFRCWIVMRKIECERDDSAFMSAVRA
jgi:hypothetical protein